MSFQYSDYEDSDMEPIEEEEEQEIKFLTHAELETEMKESISEVEAILQVKSGVCRILLHKFKWNKEALFDRFYDTLDTHAFLVNAHVIPSSSSSSQEGPSTVILNSECDICCEMGELSGLACAHRACSNCWKSYLSERIQVGRQCEIECMASKCQLFVEDEKIRFYIDDPLVLGSYEQHKVNSYVMTNPYTKWCPGRDCGRAVKTTSTTPQLISCPCGARFCFCCGQDWHEPITCDFLKLWIQRCKDDSETFNWIVANTKDCPKCNVTIEKNGGCNHMTCRSQTCKFEFCWLCMGDWKDHNQQGCNAFDDQKEQNREKSRASLERYLFYYNRYMTHKQSLGLEQKLKAKVAQKMELYQEPPVNMTYVEVKCLEKAVETLSICRETLLYSYAFAFYLRKNNSTLIFEANQNDLQLAVETLSGLLERDMELDLVEKVNFVQLVRKIQDKARYVEARRKVLLEHCVEGYEKDSWCFNKAL